MFILSFSISFVCLVVILLILSVFPLWYSAPAHSPSGNELNPPSYEDGHFSRGGSRTAATSVNYYTKRSILDVAAVLDPPLKLRCSIFISCHQFLSPVSLFYFLFHLFLGLSNSSLTLRQRAQILLSGKIMFLRTYCFVNIITLSCLGSLWFGTHANYSLNPYVYLQYL